MPKKYTVKDNQTGRTITFNWNQDVPPTDTDMEEVFKSAREQFNPIQKPTTAQSDATSQMMMPKQTANTNGMGVMDVLRSTVPIAGTSIPNIALGSPQQKGAYAKTLISTGLPFLSSGLSAPLAPFMAGAMGASGEILGTKAEDLLTGNETPKEKVVSDAITSMLLNAGGEGIGRLFVGATNKALSPFAKGYQPEIDQLANKYGMTLPASATTTNRAVPLLESVSGKSAFGNKLTQMTINAEKKLTDLADDFITKIDKTPDASVAGIKSSEGLKQFENTFREQKNKLYDIANIKKGDVTVNPQETIQTLDDIISEIRNSANPNSKALNYFTKLKNGLSKGDAVQSQLQKQGFNESTIQKIMKQQKVPTGIDATTIRNTIKQLNREINFGTSEYATGFQSELRKVGATLSNEFDDALGSARPDLKSALDKANAVYKEGISKLNSSYGKVIRKYSEAGQYSKIADAVLNKSTPVEDIPKIFEIVGDEGKDALRANLADRMIGEAKRNAKDVFTPSQLDKTIKQFGEKRLQAIYTPEEFQTLKDFSKLASVIGNAQKVAEGSQTTFTAKMSGVIALSLTNPLLAMKFLTSDAVFAKIISSKLGQNMLRGGYKLPQFIQQAVPNATRVSAQSLMQ